MKGHGYRAGYRAALCNAAAREREDARPTSAMAVARLQRGATALTVATALTHEWIRSRMSGGGHDRDAPLLIAPRSLLSHPPVHAPGGDYLTLARPEGAGVSHPARGNSARDREPDQG